MHDYNLISSIKTLHSWRRPLVFITAGAALLSVIVTLLMPNYYKASTVFYAASQDLFKPQKVFGYTQSDMYYYGGSEDIERLLTAGTSHEVISHLVQEFDLYSHYGVKPGTEKAAYRVRQRLLDHYRVNRTKYDALEIIVEDTDREMAAQMANAAREKIDNVITSVIKSSQKDLIISYGAAISAKEISLRAVEDSLRKFQAEYGIYDPEAQSEYLSTLVTSVETRLARESAMLESYRKNKGVKGAVDSIGHLTARIAGLEQQRLLLSGADTSNHSQYSFRRFSEGKGRVELYDDAYRKAVNTLNLDREILKQMEAALALDVTAVHLIEAASVPVIKSRPKRSLIVIAVTLAAFLFTAFGILVIESLKGHDWSFLKW